MQEYSALTGREYGPIKTYMCDDAETVMLGLGSVMDDVQAVAAYLRGQCKKVGVISVKLLQPFPEAEVVAALSGKKAVTVLEPKKIERPHIARFRGDGALTLANGLRVLVIVHPSSLLRVPEGRGHGTRLFGPHAERLQHVFAGRRVEPSAAIAEHVRIEPRFDMRPRSERNFRPHRGDAGGMHVELADHRRRRAASECHFIAVCTRGQPGATWPKRSQAIWLSLSVST